MRAIHIGQIVYRDLMCPFVDLPHHTNESKLFVDAFGADCKVPELGKTSAEIPRIAI